ncbi:MAG TPA: hypothetical protein VIR81_10205, partial [Myxococcales bacterium]
MRLALHGAVSLASAALLAGAAAAADPAAKPPRPARGLAPLSGPAPATPLPVRPVKARATPSGSGTVLYVTARRAYLDAGDDAGLAPGQALSLTRGGRPAGTCTVEAVTDRSATCASADARGGDRFALPAAQAARADPGPPPKALPALVAGGELARRRAEVEAAAPARVEYLAPPTVELRRGAPEAVVSFEHLSFFASGAQALHDERLEARVYGAAITPGWRLFLDASAWYRSSADARRFRPGDPATLEVRELQVASREADRPYALAFGRVMPWSAPGATPFDGAQVGWRGRGFELGAFGGAVPDVLTTGPGTSRATAGAYGALERASEDTLLRGEGRVAYVRSPELGTRLEGEVRSFLLVGRTVNIEGMLRAGVGGQHQAPNLLDVAQIDLSGRPLPRLALSGLFRYAGLDVPDAAAPALFPGHERRWDGSAGYEVGPALLSAAGGWG